jgi:hypothetical protein
MPYKFHCVIGRLSSGPAGSHSGLPREGEQTNIGQARVPSDYVPKRPANPNSSEKYVNPFSPEAQARMYQEAVDKLEAGKQEGLARAAEESERFKHNNSLRQKHSPNIMHRPPF